MSAMSITMQGKCISQMWLSKQNESRHFREHTMRCFGGLSFGASKDLLHRDVTVLDLETRAIISALKHIPAGFFVAPRSLFLLPISELLIHALRKIGDSLTCYCPGIPETRIRRVEL